MHVSTKTVHVLRHIENGSMIYHDISKNHQVALRHRNMDLRGSQFDINHWESQ